MGLLSRASLSFVLNRFKFGALAIKLYLHMLEVDKHKRAIRRVACNFTCLIEAPGNFRLSPLSFDQELTFSADWQQNIMVLNIHNPTYHVYLDESIVLATSDIDQLDWCCLQPVTQKPVGSALSPRDKDCSHSAYGLPISIIDSICFLVAGGIVIIVKMK
ncbi:hypothetical protein BO71DRAFT_479350 [Aspergillus ellipticus CBS 707.79]|uniref:Uncharacterized protein n=1 Tax=Aspergillus ellipticus CBS 707.79 TaxID=1448320 RepID=A0A319DPU1_9EURO|nr:hypothetical protein BO71DRAFT_479350 [Aspergillus ellipticus CBS 707.79]